MLTGKLTFDPELRFTPGGKQVVTMRLKVDAGIDPAQPVFTCYAWEKLAEEIANDDSYFGVAAREATVTVDGYFKTRSYKTQDGQTASVREYIVRKIWKGNTMSDSAELDRLVDKEMAAFNADAVQWETAVPETGDQIVFDTIGDVFIGLYLGSRTVLADEDDPKSAFKILMFTGVDGKPYQINSGWKLDSAFESAAVPERAIVRITYVKDVDTGRKDPMKDYRVEVAKRPA